MTRAGIDVAPHYLHHVELSWRLDEKDYWREARRAGKIRATKLTPGERREIARNAVLARSARVREAAGVGGVIRALRPEMLRR
jgi:hypothetical protein